jgi:tetratricopeptide (TPR) repeat protein
MDHRELVKRQEQFAKKSVKEVGEIVILFADETADAEETLHLPKSHVKKRVQKIIQDTFETFKQRLENGASKLTSTLIELSFTKPELYSDDVVNGLAQAMNFISTKDFQKSYKSFAKEVLADKTCQDMLNMNEVVLDSLYQAAKYLYENQNYQDAADAFSVLTLLHTKKHAFWMGLANSEYFCDQLESALFAYTMAAHTNPTDPSAYICSSKCYAQNSQFDNAINCLDLALIVIDNVKTYDKLKLEVRQEKQRLVQKTQK